MRFGAFTPQGWRFDLVGIEPAKQWETTLSVARTIERLGFESVWVYDHFHTFPEPSQESTFEAWTLMAALAASTETVRLGQMCTCNGYRSPAYLAKVATTIDNISGGRLEMGIGAGWYEHEFKGYGYPFPKPAVRIGELAESVEIMRRMWTEDEVDWDGKYYKLEGAICRPKPVQQPHIPLWIAGGGEQLTLRISARHAAYTNFGATLEEFIHKSSVLADHCREVGTDFDAIVRSSNFNIICEETEADVEEKLGWIRSHFRPFVTEERLEQLVAMWRRTAGTPEQIVAKLQPWVDAGLDYMILYAQDSAYDTSALERFAREVVPAFS
jgi:F420-dependent oxidoreductase-like protein